ncbi:MAG: IS630 family transposase [Deltaproteobacteria bacterium]|nr:IS630 family transposase [Deltaproteobacteria bacterium]
MNVRYRVTLEASERVQLVAMVLGGKGAVRRLKRAQILLAADSGSTDEEIARNVSVGTSTVYRTKQRFVEEGLERALSELPRVGGQRKLGVVDESLLVAVACSKPPVGRARWTLQLLADEMVRLTVHDSVSDETIRRRLDELQLKPWQEKMWCIPKVDAEFVARMEDVLALYAEPPDERRPVVCFDETPRQLIGEDRVPVRAEPGKRRRFDYEYVRNGTANVFMFVDVNRPWRHAKVTDQRTCMDFAECMRDLVDEHYPDAERIRVVLDNLSAHSAAALYKRFAPEEARRILSRIEFHFTPKHASWLNMVEIEIGVMVRQCLGRRIAEKATLVSEITAWQRRRNAERAGIDWMFTVERAREKLGRAYPRPAGHALARAIKAAA